MKKIGENAEHVADSSKQVSDGAQNLLQGAVEQSAAVEELVATVSDVNEQIENNTNYAQQANMKTTEVGKDIESSNEQMKLMVQAMNDISHSSDEIKKIIDTIEDKKSERPEDAIEKKDAKRELEFALKKLPERERMLLVFYYHENMTLKEIGEAINVSESRVCQLHAQAIMKLRNILSTGRSERLAKSIV